MECKDCTACCTLLRIEALDKEEYTPCRYCAGGCTIYDTKPQTCTEFECAYLQAKNIPESLRPDRCGIVFIKRTDSIFSALILPDQEVTDMAKNQIQAFRNQGYSVVIISPENKVPHIALAEGHNSGAIYKEYVEFLSGNLQH